MDVRFSPEQQALRGAAAQVCDRLGPHAVGQLDDAERTAKLDAAVAASGWRELRVADEGDAPLASGVEVAIVAEELGRGLADVAFLGPTLAAELRRLSGSAPGVAAETVVLAPSLATLAVAGEAAERGVALDAQGATSALALVIDGGERWVAEVEVGAELTHHLTRADLTRPSATVTVASSAPLGGGRPLRDADLDRWTALGLALTSADLVGAMRGAIDLSVEYVSARRQFDRPVGSFQAVQHLLADAYVLTEGSRSVALHAAWAVDALDPADALGAAAVAKAYCARAARTVGETAIQVHGGIGNTWECLAHLFLRRSLLSSEVLGGADANLERVLGHRGIGGERGLQ